MPKRSTTKATPESIQRNPNQRDIAYERLQNLWLERKIQPQQWLSQRQLVEITGSPMASVRDALKRMEAEGFVVLHPKRGVYTLEVTPDQINEIYDFRLLLEVPAAGRAAERPDLVRLGEMLKTSRDLYETRLDSDKVWDAELPLRIANDMDFHRLIIHALNNDFIADMLEKALSRQRLYRLTFPGSNTREGVALAEHIEVLKAIIASDPAKATEEMSTHLNNARMRTLNFI
jgi:DNA-binding GntR family transcriptional regulator